MTTTPTRRSWATAVSTGMAAAAMIATAACGTETQPPAEGAGDAPSDTTSVGAPQDCRNPAAPAAVRTCPSYAPRTHPARMDFGDDGRG